MLIKVKNKDTLLFDDFIFRCVVGKKGISEKTLNLAFENVNFLEQVIKYDRKQPEFFEDTLTYVSKRANNFRKNKAKNLFTQNKNLFIKGSKKYQFLHTFQNK